MQKLLMIYHISTYTYWLLKCLWKNVNILFLLSINKIPSVSGDSCKKRLIKSHHFYVEQSAEFPHFRS